MQKPYRGDYKPDYEKWKKRCELKSSSILVIMFRWVFILAVIGFIGSYFFDKPNFNYYNFWKDSVAIGDIDYWKLLIFLTIVSKIIGIGIVSFENEDDSKYRQYAENEAEQCYQEDLDRYYHYLNAQDEIEDRKLARELKRKRAFNELDNESLIYQYSQLQAIQNQSNQQAYLFFLEAQKALRNNQRSLVEDALDELEKAFGV